MTVAGNWSLWSSNLSRSIGRPKKKNRTSLMSIHSDLTFRSIVIVPGRRFNVKDKGIGAILLAAYGVFFSVGCHLSFEVTMASRLVFSPVL